MSDLGELSTFARERGWPVDVEPAADVFGWRRARLVRDGQKMLLIFAGEKLERGYLAGAGRFEYQTTRRTQVRNWLSGVVGEVC